MPTNDFVEDAVDSLTKDESVRFVLVIARPGSRKTQCFISVRTREGLDFLRRRALAHLSDIREELPE